MKSKPDLNPQPQLNFGGDLRKLRANTSATVDEVRAFLKEMRGKSPKEMLGVVASSTLVKSTLQAAVVTLVGILLFTIVPYVWNAMFPKTAAVVAPAAPETPAPTPAAAPAKTPETAPAAEPTPKAVETLGIGEQKDAPPTVNPLEKSSDDILKELKN